MGILTLSTIKPDWQDLVSQLQLDLTKRDTWKDFIEGATGQTIIELQAAIGAYDQYGIESQTQEVFPSTAKNNSSLYAAAMMLGLRLNRKLPAQITVNISAPANITIPALTQFNGANSFFFNRTALNITPVPTPFTLYQGKIQNYSVNGSGTDFQAFVAQEKDFAVSDQDVIVKVNGVSQVLTLAGLWQVKNQTGVQDLTLPDGRLLLMFGSNLFGTKPLTTDVVQIAYAVTGGSDGNNLVTNGKTLTSDLYPQLTTVCTTNATGGSDETSPFIYKSVLATTFGTFGSAVTRNQYLSVPLTYSGVLDGITFAQREINQFSLKWMNVVKVVLLTSSPWSSGQKDTFITFLQNSSLYPVRAFIEDPMAVPINIQAEVFCSNNANLSQIQADVQTSLQILLAAQPKMLNRNIYRSDIIEAIAATSPLIEYITLDTPTTDTFVERNPIAKPILTEIFGTAVSSAQQVAAAGPTYVDETANANNSTSNDYVLFPPASVNGDYTLIGYSTKFPGVAFDYLNGTVGTVGVVVWEYWNGSAWTALSGVTDNTNSFKATAANGVTVTWTVPSDWATTTLNSQGPFYFVRARITTNYTIRPTMTQGYVIGNLTVGARYDYAIGYTLASTTGEIAPTNWVTDLSLSTGKTAINLNWTAVPNVSNYRVWGRTTTGTLGLLATLPNTQTSFVDTGGITVVPPLIDSDTIPIRYCTVGTINISAQFSTRAKI